MLPVTGGTSVKEKSLLMVGQVLDALYTCCIVAFPIYKCVDVTSGSCGRGLGVEVMGGGGAPW